MKTLILYQSNTGFTAQYANWIATTLQGEAHPIKQMPAQTLAAYDTIIFGGWIMGNMIMGLDKLKKQAIHPSAVFAVGATPKDSAPLDLIRSQNNLEDTPFFYLEGGFHFDQLGLAQKTLLRMVKKSVAKKAEKTAQDLYMEKNLGTSFDLSDTIQIQPLVDFISQR